MSSQEEPDLIEEVRNGNRKGRLYLGSYAAAKNCNWLLSNRIRYVYNVTVDKPHACEKLSIYHRRIPVEDNSDANISYYFDSVADDVYRLLENGEQVLIHCHIIFRNTKNVY